MNNNERRTLFEEWLQKKDLFFDLHKFERLISDTTSKIGIPIISLFDETDSTKIRLLTSELIIKRNNTNISNIADYLLMINVLICYVDYLNNYPAAKKESTIRKENLTMDTLTIAYYLSRFDIKAVNSLGFISFREAFSSLASTTGQKASTLKNMRDEFDPYFDNGRVGWYQRKLKGSRKEVYDKYINTSYEQLTSTVNSIIEKYKNMSVEIANSNGHKKITIKSNSMKEYSRKKR